MKLTEHFTLEELTATQHRQFDNTPNEQEIANLKRLATLLETVRTIVNNPIVINSGFRSKEVNDSVGSKDSSQHRLGCAADIRVLNMTPFQVVSAIKNSVIRFDQLILEFNSWTHISVPNTELIVPRRNVLVIDKTGTYPFKT
jgi:hypothetical protein